jgi:SnoaL-like domain
MMPFRPRAAMVGVTVAAACIVAVTVRGADADLSAVQLRVNRLEALIDRVEAISAIKRLQHAYGHYSELGLWHDFADLFADTGIGHYTQGALDREGIRALFLKEVGGGQLGLADGRIYPHISMQPVVTLAADGQSGKGRWHIMAMLGGYGRSASWAGGVYENEYVRENGIWKFKDVRYLPQYSGRYEDAGWTATREPAPFHFDAARVGKPILDAPEPPRAASSASQPPTVAALALRAADLAARAQRLSDEIEVTNLQHAYGYYVDRKMWDDVADLFAADGTMEIGLQGVYAGRTSIRRGLNAFGPAGLADGEINDHIHVQTIVTVLPDGRTARARGTDLGMIATGNRPPSPHGFGGARALWSQSIYENEFVKQDGVWKIKALNIYPRFIVDAEKGWAKDAQPAPGPSRDFPPDRPPTTTYEIYPRFHIAPLHFDHPVTGRPPQYPEGTIAAPHAASPTRNAPTPVKSAAALASLLAASELSLERSKAYHASENLVTAYGYQLDESAWDKTPDILALHQIVQPVIHVSADARSAKIRARLFQLGGPAGGEGSWTSGIYENTSVDERGTWKLSRTSLSSIWTAPSRGGSVRVMTLPATVPFHYKNPVSGRVPPVPN